ncbi:MAG: hypothetical protein BJ554DRAFT_7462 [Olpidium bornovanus]|uniref:Uncharacterized protein n=1 Tax=Olpidium bornovanus TaxID=278681 RepID=A0A8H7ZW42_9FUNG|nr:MAG: hypothetical protein BJ554DRAFT_7462 [Olpidium bornovanus]
MFSISFTRPQRRGWNLSRRRFVRTWPPLGMSALDILELQRFVVFYHLLIQSANLNVPQCNACSTGKFIAQPSRWKLPTELPGLLQRLHGDIHGPVSLPCGPFRYFMVLGDACGQLSAVWLLPRRTLLL